MHNDTDFEVTSTRMHMRAAGQQAQTCGIIQDANHGHMHHHLGPQHTARDQHRM